MNKNLILKIALITILVQTFLSSSISATTTTFAASPDRDLIEMRKQVLIDAYDWTMEGEWTLDELMPIFKAAYNLQLYVEDLTGTDGQTWIKENIGSITFHRGTIINIILHSHIALPNGHIYLHRDPEYNRNNTYDILHEVAHVLDARHSGSFPEIIFSTGPSSQMIDDLGGNSEACFAKFICPINYSENIAGPDGWDEGAYGNWSVADDFAETLSLTVFKPEQVPPARISWMENYIKGMAQ